MEIFPGDTPSYDTQQPDKAWYSGVTDFAGDFITDILNSSKSAISSGISARIRNEIVGTDAVKTGVYSGPPLQNRPDLTVNSSDPRFYTYDDYGNVVGVDQSNRSGYAPNTRLNTANAYDNRPGGLGSAFSQFGVNFDPTMLILLAAAGIGLVLVLNR